MSRQQDTGHSWLGIHDVLSQSLKQVNHAAEVSTGWAGLCWALAVGKELAAVSFVIKVAPKTIYIEVKGKEWAPALEGLKKKIIGEIRQQEGFEGLKQIIFKESPPSNSSGIHPRPSVKKSMHSNSNPSAVQRSLLRSNRRK